MLKTVLQFVSVMCYVNNAYLIEEQTMYCKNTILSIEFACGVMNTVYCAGNGIQSIKTTTQAVSKFSSENIGKDQLPW